MNFQVVIGGDDFREFATGKGLEDFGLWADSLSVSKYFHVVQFVEHGISQDLDSLQKSLELAMKHSAPESESAKDVANGLIASLKQRKADAVSIFITNGVIADDGEDEDWHGEDFDP